MRLVAGVVSGLSGTSHLVGDASLSKRPMDRVAIPLRMMGAQIVGEGERVTAPLTIDGGSLRAISYDSPVGSAQIKSAILFAGLFAQGETTVREPIRSRTATEDMMVAAGIDLRSGDVGEGRSVTLVPSRPRAHLWKVPGDPSQAAFFCVAGVIHSDAQIVIDTIDDSRERTGFISVLQRMGALIQWLEGGQLSVTSSALQATEVDSSEIPSVDEVPILVVAAAAATGVSRFTDMSELRVKESDRFAASISLANALGARSWQEGDDFCVEGLGSADEFLPVNYVSNLDHRLVMSAAVAAACGQGGVITGAEAVASSYPNFFQDLNSLQ
jgi:3-phosphoshikimate 1-carboxyvinyltransferase